VKFSCRYRRRWCVGLICRLGKTAKDEFIAASTHYPVLCIAENAGIFTAECIGTTEDVNPSSGGVLAAWKRKDLIAPLGLLVKLRCKRL